MTARLRDGLNHERAKLLGELRELMHVEPAQVRRRADGFEKRLLSHLGAAYRGWGHFSENARSRSRRSGQGGQPRLRERRDRSRRVRARRGRGRAVHEPARGRLQGPGATPRWACRPFHPFRRSCRAWPCPACSRECRPPPGRRRRAHRHRPQGPPLAPSPSFSQAPACAPQSTAA